MDKVISTIEIINVTPENVYEETLFCIKDIKKPGFKNKCNWFEKRYDKGLRIKILKKNGKMTGFIEYVPADKAWRPVKAPNFMFIHCMYIYSKQDRNKGYGSMLIKEAELDAKDRGLSGVCVMTSNGAWITNKSLFEKNGYKETDSKGRFELLSKKWKDTNSEPTLIDWTKQQKKYKGWHLLYSDQCPWHEKSVLAICKTAREYGIDIQVKKLITSEEAKNAPSGYGVFNLLHNGKLLEDHYISEGRFRNILKKELAEI